MLAERIRKTKIQKMQLDPFGYCNAKCWFCPVRYFPQPEEGAGNMPVELIDKILSDITSEMKNGVVDPTFNLITTSHYNEILLYKDLEKLLSLFRKYKFSTFILSNGLSLIPEKTDLIVEYSDVVKHIGLNVPAFEAELWANRTGFSVSQFDRLLNNLKYASQKLAFYGNEFTIGINGLNNSHVIDGYIKLGPKFSSLNYDLNFEHSQQYRIAKSLFPNTRIEMNPLYDRVDSISDFISNQEFLSKRNANKKVVGCGNWGDRSTEWLNVNSAGNVFLCCNDYNFDYKFGNLNDQSLREIWLSDLHFEVVERAYSQICTKCYSAKVI